MKLIDLLGRHLKDDEVVDLLEQGDMKVTYEFDRLHENVADYYTSEAQAGGFALRFNENQILDTVFCYVAARHGFLPVEPDLVGVPLYRSIAAAETAAQALGAKVTQNNGVEFMGRVTSWVRLERDRQWWHFEYANNALALVTLMLPK